MSDGTGDDLPPLLSADIERLPLGAFAEKAYLDYSMYVILDRALPHVADGLKPVQRRIVYAMSELALGAGSKHKKSARTVGDVIGKYHPHGDSACYEAMVLMSQPFSYRYPLVDGQGNWGSQDDPKSFAAMRYTEARLTRFSEVLLSELGQGTVDWGPNFDGTLYEPELLPARLPHVLLNGGSGIAVGMATDIPPHNAREVAAAAIALLEDPKLEIEELCEHVQGPDFPTEAEIITPREELLDLYRTGQGSVRVRARWKMEEGTIVVWALPFQASGSKILSQIAGQMEAKKLPMVSDLRDESDHEHAVRLVITPRSNRVDMERLMEHLFATTDLERSVRVQMNVITLEGRPQLLDLKTILAEWLEFRTETTRRRLRFRLDKVEKRLHILEGLLVAFLDLDEVIRIIREEDDPKARLIERFTLSEIQAEAILETKLRHLAKLEEMKIRGEQDELLRERDDLVQILDSKRRLRTLVRKELEEAAEKYGDERRSPLVERESARALSESDLIPSEPVTVILSARGWVRAAKGHDVDGESLSYRSGDKFLASAEGRTNHSAVFLDDGGRAYTLAAHTLPSARGHGEPLTGSVQPPGGATFVGVTCGADEELRFLSTDAGYGFVCRIDDMTTKNRAGKALITVPRGARVLPPCLVQDADEDLLVTVSDQGYLLAFPVSELSQLARGKGLKLQHLPKTKRAGQDRLVACAVLRPGQRVLAHAGLRYLNLGPSDLETYRADRSSRGTRLPRGFQNVSRLEVVSD